MHGGVGAGAATGARPVVLMCLSTMLPVGAYPGGAAFAHAYEHAFGGAQPDTVALFGYTAMEIALNEIAGLGAAGDNRTSLRSQLFDDVHQTPLGTISFDSDGDSTLGQFGLYAVEGAADSCTSSTSFHREDADRAGAHRRRHAGQIGL